MFSRNGAESEFLCSKVWFIFLWKLQLWFCIWAEWFQCLAGSFEFENRTQAGNKPRNNKKYCRFLLFCSCKSPSFFLEMFRSRFLEKSSIIGWHYLLLNTYMNYFDKSFLPILDLLVPISIVHTKQIQISFPQTIGQCTGLLQKKWKSYNDLRLFLNTILGTLKTNLFVLSNFSNVAEQSAKT